MATLAAAGTDPQVVVETVLRAVNAFADGAPQADDITALAVRHAR
jgi:serine phosphatase RsbU (regulator of sigma subunit)